MPSVFKSPFYDSQDSLLMLPTGIIEAINTDTGQHMCCSGPREHLALTKDCREDCYEAIVSVLNFEAVLKTER
jgi:hypothetical protein